jgi:hypothetical protein
MAAPVPEEAVVITIATSPPTNKIAPSQFKQINMKGEVISFTFLV